LIAEKTMIVIESINGNEKLTAEQKLELVYETISSNKQKAIGEIFVNAVKKKTRQLKKKDGFYPDGPLKKIRKKTVHSEAYKKKHSKNQEALLTSVKADSEGRY